MVNQVKQDSLFLNRLNCDVQVNCFSFLSKKTLLGIARVSKGFHTLTQDERLWKSWIKEMQAKINFPETNTQAIESDKDIKKKILETTKRIFLFLKRAESQHLDKEKINEDPFCIWPSSKWSIKILLELKENHSGDPELVHLLGHAKKDHREFVRDHKKFEGDNIIDLLLPMDSKARQDFSKYHPLLRKYRDDLANEESSQKSGDPEDSDKQPSKKPKTE